MRRAVCGTCGNRSYYTNHDNTEIDKMVETGAAELDEAKRAAIYAEIQKIATTEVAYIPLYYPPFANAYSKKLTGLRMTPALQWTLEGAGKAD